MSTPKSFMRIADVLAERGYHLGHEIGEGTYSKVRSAERLSDGRMCAVKIVDRCRVRKDYLLKFMPRELEIVLKLNHPNVIRTYEVIRTRDIVFQVMQYAERGDLLHMIHECSTINEDKAKQIFSDISNGIEYMHKLNICHRDLKCENILIFQDKTAAISDFGFARAFDNGITNNMCRTFCGSTAYASPELLRGIAYDAKSNDIWSMGCILFTMLCGTMPFNDNNVTIMVQKQLARDIQFPTRVADGIGPECKQFLKKLLDPDINKRLTANQILQSVWLTETSAHVQ